MIDHLLTSDEHKATRSEDQSIRAVCEDQRDEGNAVIADARSVVLALDLGTTFGYAKRFSNGEIVSGALKLKGTHPGARFFFFTEFLENTHASTPISRIIFEEVRGHKGMRAAQVYGGFEGGLMGFIYAHTIPFLGVPPTTLKKAITGTGRADKTQMIDAILARGFSCKDHNEADAIALLLYAETTGIPPVYGR